MNDALRLVGGEKYGRTVREYSQRQIGRLDEIFDQSHLATDVELWRSPGSGRGIFGDSATWGDDLAGFEWSDPAYSSTSASKRVADRFTKDGGVRLRVLAPKGSKAIQLSELDPFEGQVFSVAVAGLVILHHPHAHAELDAREGAVHRAVLEDVVVADLVLEEEVGVVAAASEGVAQGLADQPIGHAEASEV
jgi:hypothetical protein